jgi:hypothetical protein
VSIVIRRRGKDSGAAGKGIGMPLTDVARDRVVPQHNQRKRLHYKEKS